MSRIPTIELINNALNDLRTLYLKGRTPWVVGFSGGKDSSTVVQLVYRMLLDLPQDKRCKTVHIVASDTLVENPFIEDYLDRILRNIAEGAATHRLPMVVQKVMPRLADTFWVNLLGKGYPAPNRFFRWCTDRLKIGPTTRYIQGQIDQFGQVIILLGSRTDESSSRAQVLENRRLKDSELRRHATLPQAYVYAPIADWRADDVWSYLIANPPAWGGSNDELRGLYRDAASGECPLVIDKTTPSCGQSRFGCWTCTVVSVDNSMEGFLETGRRYERLMPLLEFRNKLKAYRDDPTKRESWRKSDPSRPRGYALEDADSDPQALSHMEAAAAAEPEIGASTSTADNENAEVQLHLDGGQDGQQFQILGPFKLDARQQLLEELLRIQKQTGFSLIRHDELELIRQHWTSDYRVGALAMLEILERIYGPGARREQVEAERELLIEVCETGKVDILVLDRLLDLERGYVTKLRKRGLLPAIDGIMIDVCREDSGSADS